MSKSKPRKKPGPAPLPPEQRARVVSTKLSPELVAWVAEQGGGSVTRGLRLVVTAARELLPCSVRLLPAEREWLARTYGSVNAGVRALVAEAMGETRGK